MSVQWVTITNKSQFAMNLSHACKGDKPNIRSFIYSIHDNDNSYLQLQKNKISLGHRPLIVLVWRISFLQFGISCDDGNSVWFKILIVTAKRRIGNGDRGTKWGQSNK